MTQRQRWGAAFCSCAAAILLFGAVGCGDQAGSGTASSSSKGAEGPVQEKIPPAVEASAKQRSADLEKMAKERAMAQQARH